VTIHSAAEAHPPSDQPRRENHVATRVSQIAARTFFTHPPLSSCRPRPWWHVPRIQAGQSLEDVSASSALRPRNLVAGGDPDAEGTTARRSRCELIQCSFSAARRAFRRGLGGVRRRCGCEPTHRQPDSARGEADRGEAASGRDEPAPKICPLRTRRRTATQCTERQALRGCRQGAGGPVRRGNNRLNNRMLRQRESTAGRAEHASAPSQPSSETVSATEPFA